MKDNIQKKNIKKYTSIEIIDIVNGNYEIDGKNIEGLLKNFMMNRVDREYR